MSRDLTKNILEKESVLHIEKIMLADAVERFGDPVIKKYFKKHRHLNDHDYKRRLIHFMFQEYKFVGRGGRGKGAYYILGDKREESIDYYKVSYGLVSDVANQKSRNFPEEFYQKDSCTIYIATNKITNQVYIGSTKATLASRISQHKSHSFQKKSFNYNTKISKAIREYGFDAFKWEIIQKWEDRESLKEIEGKWISIYDSINKGYNTRLSHRKMDDLESYSSNKDFIIIKKENPKMEGIK